MIAGILIVTLNFLASLKIFRELVEQSTFCNCMCWENIFLQRKAVLFCHDSGMVI